MKALSSICVIGLLERDNHLVYVGMPIGIREIFLLLQLVTEIEGKQLQTEGHASADTRKVRKSTNNNSITDTICSIYIMKRSAINSLRLPLSSKHRTHQTHHTLVK